MIIFSSSSEVYGEPVEFPQNEHTTPLNSKLPYAIVKNIGEAFLRSYQREYGLDYTIFRFFNTYGPKMHPNDGRVVSNFIIQALKGQPITIYGDGSQTRSFCYVDDLVECMIRFMASPDDFVGPMNMGNPGEFTIRELAEKVVEMTGSKSVIAYEPLPGDDPKQRKPDITLAREKLGWEPKVALEEGLVKTIAYFDQQLKDGLA